VNKSTTGAMEAGAAKPLLPSAGILPRKCACGNHTMAGGECASCQREKALGQLQRSATIAGRVNEVPPIVHEVLRSSGQPLDAKARSFFEPRFDYDFSRVRLHTDAKAAESAQAVNALAYTVGRDIVFGGGQYAPGTNAGQRLLAHELTHASQQGAVAYSAPHELAIGPAHDNYEREADAVAAHAGINGADVDRRSSLARPGLQRQPKSPARVDEKEDRPEIKITPATRTIPLAEAAQQPVPIASAPTASAPTGLPDKSAPGKSTSSDKTEKGPEIETSYQGSLAEKKITTNIEVTIPMKPWKKGVLFGQPIVLGKELKAEFEIGPPPPGPGALVANPQVALKISLKALSYEIESLKSKVKALKEFGFGVTAEAGIDPNAPFARPDLGIKAGVDAEYQIGRSPLYLQGRVGYDVKFPPQGPPTAKPVFDFGFKIVIP
jgi:hypothetical protein